MTGALEFADTWSRFVAAGRCLGPSPGSRETWHRGRSRYAVWVLRVSDPRVHERMRAVARDLGPAIEPVAASEAHITTFVAGFPTAAAPLHDDDITEQALAVQAREVSARASALRLELEVAGANAFQTCAFLEVEDPHGSLAELRSLLETHAPEVRFAAYQPHVTVGRFRATEPAAPLAARLAPHRVAAPIPIEPSALELVTFDAVAEGPVTLVTRWAIPFACRSGDRASASREFLSP